DGIRDDLVTGVQTCALPIFALPLVWRQRRKVLEQFFEIGNASLLMVCMLSFFIGGVICLNFGPTLVERSFTSAVGGVVGIAIAKDRKSTRLNSSHQIISYTV